MIKYLGKYTVESGIIYFKSLLRGSILYATESMINLKESDFKIIEKAEESTLRDLVKTEVSAPRHLLYLELGILPARFVIKEKKVMQLKHILVQNENSLIKKVFDSQIKSPTKGDWASEVLSMLEEIKIRLNLREIKEIPKNKLKNIVNIAVEKLAFKYLIGIQKQKLKGRNINYTNLSFQPYFRPRENIKLEAQREIFALRTKMNHIRANSCSSKDIEKCNICQCEMDNENLFKCTKKNPNNINYNHILN